LNGAGRFASCSTVVLVLIDDDRLAARRGGHRHDLVGEVSTLLRRGRAHVAHVREVVRLLARDPVSRREVLDGDRHGEVVVAVGQGQPQVVLEVTLAEAEPPARAPDDVRLLGHGFRPGRQDHLRLPQSDQLCRRDHGLEPGAAETVDGHRRNSDRTTRSEPDVTREVHLRPRRLNGVSHDDVVDLIGRDPASLERPPTGLRAELDGADVRERTAERAERGTSSFHDDDVLLCGSIVH
jgi:hypothetical protein